MSLFDLGFLAGSVSGVFGTLFLGLVAVSVTEWRRSRNPWRDVERRGER